MAGNEKRILIGIDRSPESERAVQYVGRVMRGSEDVEVRLLHLVTAEEAGLESGEKVVVEGTTEAEEAEKTMKERAHGLIDRAFTILSDAGLPAETAEAEVRTSPVDVDVARDCLAAARENDCGTIVLGRSSLGSLGELFHKHPSDELVRRAKGLAVWVVE